MLKRVIKHVETIESCAIMPETTTIKDDIDVLGQMGIKAECIIDNDEYKHGKTIEGLTIKPLETFLEEEKNPKITIISKNPEVIEQIKWQLRVRRLVEYVDFAQIDQMNWAWDIREKNRCAMRYIEIMITGKCTLACEKCGLCIPYFKNPRHRVAYEVKKDIDSYFQYVDFVDTFRVLGGEPLFHPELVDIIDYIGSAYRTKMSELCIVTNGTILPKDDVLRSCQNYRAVFHISDYTDEVKYGNEMKELIGLLNKYEIKSEVLKFDWTDLGLPIHERELSRTQLIQMFRQCRATCKSIYDGKIFACAQAGSALFGGLREEVDKGDYIDLKNSAKNKILDGIFRSEFDMPKDGYLPFCQYCDANGGVNGKKAIPGRQIKERIAKTD